MNEPSATAHNQPQRRGVIPPEIARKIAFAIITLALCVCTMLALLAIWDRMAGDVLWRSLATLAVIIVATGLFTAVNEHYGRE